MELTEMEMELTETKNEFWGLLMMNSSEDSIKEFLKKKLEMFAGQFEEQTLMETLKESYGEYLETLALEVGA